MLLGLRRHYANIITSAGHLLLVVVGFQIDTPPGWVAVLSVIGAISFIAWASNLRRYRVIGDTPTSRVASAAQGYVELIGRAANHQPRSIASKLMGLPCVWYRFRVERRTSDNKWEHMDSGESTDTFVLNDGSGHSVIDPEGAEIVTTHKQTWLEGDYRYTEWVLSPGDNLYAIGQFRTLDGETAPLDFRGDLNALLNEWKRDHPALLERFDANLDGTIDLDEWEKAREAAHREVQRQHRDIRLNSSTVHLVHMPADGRLYLLSNLPPEKLAFRYRLWGWVHLAVVFVAAGFAVHFAAQSGLVS